MTDYEDNVIPLFENTRPGLTHKQILREFIEAIYKSLLELKAVQEELKIEYNRQDDDTPLDLGLLEHGYFNSVYESKKHDSMHFSGKVEMYIAAHLDDFDVETLTDRLQAFVDKFKDDD